MPGPEGPRREGQRPQQPQQPGDVFREQVRRQMSQLTPEQQERVRKTLDRAANNQDEGNNPYLSPEFQEELRRRRARRQEENHERRDEVSDLIDDVSYWVWWNSTFNNSDNGLDWGGSSPRGPVSPERIVPGGVEHPGSHGIPDHHGAGIDMGAMLGAAGSDLHGGEEVAGKAIEGVGKALETGLDLGKEGGEQAINAIVEFAKEGIEPALKGAGELLGNVPWGEVLEFLFKLFGH